MYRVNISSLAWGVITFLYMGTPLLSIKSAIVMSSEGISVLLFLIGCKGRRIPGHHDVNLITLSENDEMTSDKGLLQLIGGKGGANVILARCPLLIGDLGGLAVWQRVYKHYFFGITMIMGLS